MAKIFIDPGHGGHDPGAVGSKSKEKDNVLNVAKRLKKELESLGYTVKLSRSTDIFLTLSERARRANSCGADIFISLHNNAATSSATGFETFVYNGKISSKTKRLQDTIHDEIIKEIGIRDRGKKRANFAVLRLSNMPAVLIEYAFISNKNDEKILINEVNKLAKLTANGISRFFGGKVVKNSSSKTNSKSNNTTKKTTTTKTNKSTHTGSSIVDYLKSKGIDHSPANRSKLAKEYGVKNYTTSAEKNLELLNAMKQGKKSTSKDKKQSVNTKKGNAVKIKKSATKFATGQTIASFAKGKSYKIIQEKSDRVLLDGIMSWVYKKDLEGYSGNSSSTKKTSKKPINQNYTTGQKIKIKNSAKKYATGETIPSRFKNKTYTVQQVKGDRVLIKELYSWVKKSDLQ